MLDELQPISAVQKRWNLFQELRVHENLLHFLRRDENGKFVELNVLRTGDASKDPKFTSYPYVITIAGVPQAQYERYSTQKILPVVYERIWPDNEESFSVLETVARKYKHWPILAKFCGQLNNMMFDVYVKPIPQRIRFALAYNYAVKAFDGWSLRRILSALPLVQQLEKDDILHLAPFVVAFKSDPQRLKELFGSGHWKRICKNSLNRNKLLVKAIVKSNGLHKLDEGILDVPSTLLQKHYSWPTRHLLFLERACKEKKKKMTDVDFAYVCRSLITDAENMALDIRYGPDRREVVEIQEKDYRNTERYAAAVLARRLEEEERAKVTDAIYRRLASWSMRRLQEEHDKMADIINARDHSKESFAVSHPEYCEHLTPDNFTRSVLGVKFALLESPFAMGAEGNAMHHCIVSYTAQVSEGDYVAIHVESDTVSCTLGLRRRKSTGREDVSYEFNQMHGKYNSPITDEAVKAAVDLYIRELNKQGK